MPVPGDPHDEAIVPLLEAELRHAPPALSWFDAHTHIGADDPDGFAAVPADIIGGLDRAGHERALVFSSHHPGGYRGPNDEALAAAKASSGRLTALARVDPSADAQEEARRAIGAGARGIKLHPRSDRFTLDHPGVESAVAAAAAERGIVLVHAGRGIPHLGEDALALAGRHPGARIVLAHAGISDLSWLADRLPEVPNLFFDTSWWQIDDLLALFATVAPGRILYASDMPYGSARFGGLAMLRCARAVGLGEEAVRAIAGGQLARLVAGGEPIDVGPAPGPSALRARAPAHARATAWVTAGVSLSFAGADPTEALALSRLACRHGREEPLLDAVDRLVAHAQQQDADGRIHALLAAQVLAGTGWLSADRL